MQKMRLTFSQNKATISRQRSNSRIFKSRYRFFNKTNKISFTTNEVFVSNDGNMVVEIGYYKVVDSANTAINTGNYMVLFEKRDGRYVSVRDMSASDMPVE